MKVLCIHDAETDVEDEEEEEEERHQRLLGDPTFKTLFSDFSEIGSSVTKKILFWLLSAYTAWSSS